MRNLSILAFGAVALVACSIESGDESDTTVPTPPPVIEEAVEVLPVFEGELGELSDQVAGLLNTTLNLEVYPEDLSCIGNFDMIAGRIEGEAEGLVLTGWAWDVAAESPVQEIVVVDSSDMIVGGMFATLSRQDVSDSRPEIEDEMTGWVARTATTTGELRVYGLDAETSSVCLLGAQTTP